MTYMTLDRVDVAEVRASLTAPAVATDTVLQVDFVTGFPAAGSVALNGATYSYTAVTETSVTLAAPLDTTAAADDVVQLLGGGGSPAVEWRVWGSLGDGDPVPALIPTPSIPFFTEGFADAGRVVEVELYGSGYRVVHRPDEQPVVDASYLEPGSLRDAIPDDYTYLGNVAVENLVGRFLWTQMVLAASETDVARSEMDSNGFRAYRSDGSVFFNVSLSEAVVIADGIINAKQLTTSEGASLGKVTEIAKGGSVRLTKGTTAPGNPPTVTLDYPSVQFTDDGFWGDRYGWATDGTYWYTARLDANKTMRAEKWNAAGSRVQDVPVASAAQGSSVVGGGNVYTLRYSVSSLRWYVEVLAATTLAYVTSYAWNDADGARTPAIGWDAANATNPLLIAQSKASDDKVTIRRYPLPAIGATLPLVQASSVTTVGTDVGGLAGVAYGSFDLGAPRYVYAKQDGVDNQTIRVLSTTGVRQTGQEWRTGAGAGMARGLAWDGASFRSMNTVGLQRTYTGIQQDSIWVSSTLRSATAANISGGVGAETNQSPRASYLAGVRRTRINYSASPIQGTANANDPTAVSIYVGTGATDPGVAGMGRQAMPADGVVSGSLTALTLPPGAGNPSPPATPGTFEAGISARLETWDGVPMIDALGAIPAGAFRESVRREATHPEWSCVVRRVAPLAVIHNTDTFLPFDTEDEDPSGIHVDGAFTVPVGAAGVWRMTASVTWAVSSTGRRTIRANLNNTATQDVVQYGPSPTGFTAIALVTELRLVAGDVVRLYPSQSSGASLDITAARAVFSWVRP